MRKLLEFIKTIFLIVIMIGGIWYLTFQDSFARIVSTLLAMCAWIAIVNWISRNYFDIDQLFVERDWKRPKEKHRGKEAEGEYAYEGEKYRILVEGKNIIALNKDGKRVPPMEILMYGRRTGA